MSATFVEELISKWGFDIDFEPLEHLDEKFKEVQESVLHIAEGVGAAAATMFGFAKLTADAGEKALLASQQIGISVESYQELAYAGKLVGLSTEEMETGFVRLSRSMEEARRTGKGGVADTFRRLGLSITDSNGRLRSADNVMMAVADRFKSMPDGAQKTAMAMELFGRSGARLIPILNKGSEGVGKLRQEAHDLGVVLDAEAAEAAEEFNQNIERAEAALTGVRNIIGAALMPQITILVEQFTEYVKVNRVLIAQKVGAFFEGAAKFIKIAWSFSSSLFQSVKGLVDAFGGFERVIKVVGIAMGLFASAQVLSAIGAMVMSVYALAGAFTLANAAALLIPLAIGAAVVAIGLIIEDIVAFFQGRSSVTGIIVEKFKQAFNWVQEKINQFALWSYGKLAAWGQSVSDKIMSFFQPVVDVLTWIGKHTAKLTSQGLIDAVKGGANFMSGGLIGGDSPKTMSDSLGANANTAPVPGINSSSSKQQTNYITAPITVQSKDNASAFEVGRAVRDGAQDGLDSVLRGTYSTFQGAEGR